ncbi:glutaminase A [Alkaliphilus pronyensis]|uniref:Glutaminase n=1 Tax=Alkaliphilus pronyensis TaxID=1482732 RepID=A0A6I0F8K8_9FIRM|nr:glutaminase A [Alkaliphilus pronyensis]KAB3534844.1 glutaminase A [Alkaliphilus pronyensis]
MEVKLKRILENNRKYIEEGNLPSYIPELSNANKNALGIYVSTVEGEEWGAGDYMYPFTIQSISKVITLLIALEDNGMEIFQKVGMEPTGDAFNSMMKLELVQPSKPFNPMINAGAIAVTSMIHGSYKEKFDRIISFFRAITNNPKLGINDRVYLSEKSTGDKNRAMAYYMRDVGILQGDVEEDLDLYFKQCSIEVTCKDIARIAAFIGNKGVLKETNERLISEEYIKIAKTFMFTCGMYNASGEFAINVGIPSKSGVGGGIMSVVPSKMGIGVIGPSLDSKGNSIAGVKVLEELSKEFNLSIF